MGRKTWESLPGKLPERRHLVMTRSNRGDVETTTFEEVIKLSMEQNVFIIGGGEIYSLFLPHIEKIYRTIIHIYPYISITYYQKYHLILSGDRYFFLQV